MQYGRLDASYQAAGGESGIRQLVKDFYDNMEQLPSAKRIRDMHNADLSESRDKLYRFLVGWMGGPRLFQATYGPINIPGAHRHLSLEQEDADAWLNCMNRAIDRQPYHESFKDYLKEQFKIPAQRIMAVNQQATV